MASIVGNRTKRRNLLLAVFISVVGVDNAGVHGRLLTRSAKVDALCFTAEFARVVLAEVYVYHALVMRKTVLQVPDETLLMSNSVQVFEELRK